MRLTWKRQPRETGLRAVGAAPRGAILSVDGQQAGTVNALSAGVGSFRWKGWYWVAGWDCRDRVPQYNSCDTPTDSLEDAKGACEAYVRRALGLPPKKQQAAK